MTTATAGAFFKAVVTGPVSLIRQLSHLPAAFVDAIERFAHHK